MNTYYFTFGSEGQAFKGGWVEAHADTVTQAVRLFQVFFPDKIEGILNCSDCYTEGEFKRTEMYKNNDNLGYGCHAVITSKIEYIRKPTNKKTV